MSKRSKGAAEGSARSTASTIDRRLRRLQQRLASVREVEEKRARQAERARERPAARDLEVKRRRQLDKARRRAAELESKIAGLQNGGVAAEGPPRPSAWCLRERQSVEMIDPAPIAMRNGRSGLAGKCPSCGARLVRPVAAATGPNPHRPQAAERASDLRMPGAPPGVARS
jgi:hypothetical protein